MEYFRILSLVLALGTLGHCQLSPSTNPEQTQNNQLAQSEHQPSEQAPVSPYNYIRSNNSPSYVQNYQPYSNFPAYIRQAPAAAPSPFVGLSSNGELQLSAYFSQIFWGFVGTVVGVAAIVLLIRLIFPRTTLDNLVDKVKGSKAGKNLDLDHLTNMVYGAIDTYSKWATKDARAGVVPNPKRR